MNIQVLYQDVTTGNAWDISSIVMSPKWETQRTGSPASFKFAAVNSDVTWKEGSIVCFKEGEKGYFYGYVFKIGRKTDGIVDITAYDQIRYLKNKDTYVFSGKRADQIASMIAGDFRLKVGSMANTGYVIPKMCEDSKALLDIILKAIDLTLIHTGKMFYLWDDYGSLRISSVEDSKLDLLVGDGSMATDYEFESEIDSDTYNKIKLVRDNKDTGHRDVYIFQDSKNIQFWGVLQYFEKVDEKLNRAQIEERGGNLLELKNRPNKSFSIDALCDLSVRAGTALFIQISEIGVRQFFVVEEASHDLENETMSLKLKVV